MIRKPSSFVLAAAVSLAALAGTASAIAQTAVPAGETTSRGQVKAETKDAGAAGQLTPAGQGSAPQAEPRTGQRTTRAERKAATREARRQSALRPAGEATTPAATASSPTGARTRAEVKAETVRAQRQGNLRPAGPGG